MGNFCSIRDEMCTQLLLNNIIVIIRMHSLYLYMFSVNQPVMGTRLYSDCYFRLFLSNDILHGNVLRVRSPAIHLKRVTESLFMILIL